MTKCSIEITPSLECGIPHLPVENMMPASLPYVVQWRSRTRRSSIPWLANATTKGKMTVTLSVDYQRGILLGLAKELE